MKEENGKKKNKIWTVSSVIGAVLMLIYLVWRVVYTLPMPAEYGWVAFLGGLVLLYCEGSSIFEAVQSYVDLNSVDTPEMPVIRDDQFPEVDVMIATHNEEADLLYKTANACRFLRYPDKSKVHVWICDDTNRAEIKKMAEAIGVGYIGMSDNKDAKAGNLNNALSKTSAPLVATFDADMIPNSEFLLETVPYFFLPVMKKDKDGNWVEKSKDEIDPKEKIGFIQTPQTFYNPDLFQYNLYSDSMIPNEQDFFFRQINPGKNRGNAPIYAGSNTVISREALESVGGIATGTITEDFETGLLIESNGYRCYAIDKLLAKGLSPISIKALIKQRERWGRGCIYSLRRVHLLTNPRFNFRLKMSYLACNMYWHSFTRRLIFIFAPLLFILFKIPVVVCDLKGLLFIWLPSYLVYNYTLKKISGEIRTTRWSNIVDTIMFPYLLIPIWLETLGIRKKEFAVTNKSKSNIEETPTYMAYPHIILLAFCIVAVILAVGELVINHTLGTIVVLFWTLINAMNLVMAVFFMAGRRNERLYERLNVSIPVEIDYKDKKYKGTVVDISEGGFAFRLDGEAVYLPHDDSSKAEFILDDGRYLAHMKGKIVSVMGGKSGTDWKYCVAIDQPDTANEEQYFQMIYDRQHTLPKTLSSNSSYLGDIITNLDKRIHPVQAKSNRKTARIRVEEETALADGQPIVVHDFNFEYIRVGMLPVGEGEDKTVPACPANIVVYPGEEYELKCTLANVEKGIYKIDNFEELNDSGAWNVKLEQWEKKANTRASRK